MTGENLVDVFPLLIDKKADLFRYDRWDNLLLFEVHLNSKENVYIACHDCCFFEFWGSFSLNLVRVLKVEDVLTLTDAYRYLLVKCRSIEVWDRNKFHTYNADLYNNLSEEKMYGFRKLISSIEELP